jgi:hypothetical protein
LLVNIYYFYSATLLVVAQDADDPCLICPYGATRGDDYVPYASKDPVTCKELINDAKLFEKGSLWCALYEEAGLYCCPSTPEDPCTLCHNGCTVVADDYEPYKDGNNCLYWLEFYADFDAESDKCSVGWVADVESHCCPTEANNPCIICPGGASFGDNFVPYTNDERTCKDIIEADLTFDAESEMCLVYAKEDEYRCCPSSTTVFNDYCNICPDGATAGEDFVPWSVSAACKELIELAKLFENVSVGCNYYKGYETSCCPGAGADLENTPIPTISPPIVTPDTSSTVPSISIILSTSIPTISSPISIPDTTTSSPTSSITTNNPAIVETETSLVPTPSPTATNPLYILEVTTGIVGAVAALVGAAFAFARWKQNMNSTSTPAMPTAAATSP